MRISRLKCVSCGAEIVGAGHLHGKVICGKICDECYDVMILKQINEMEDE